MWFVGHLWPRLDLVWFDFRPCVFEGQHIRITNKNSNMKYDGHGNTVCRSLRGGLEKAAAERKQEKVVAVSPGIGSRRKQVGMRGG